MRKLTLALAVSTLALAACSQEAAEPVEPEATTAATEVEAEQYDEGVVDANSVTDEQLGMMAGVTPELAAAIREGQPYASITDLNAVLMQTLSEDEAATLRETLFVPVNLNSATREELALIPGIDDRMIHEFEEYVPYEDMAEFDREIGKYVDADEVARYRQYVTL